MPDPNDTEPWNCVAVETGGKTNQVPAGMNQRILGDEKAKTCTRPNQWPAVLSDPLLLESDPRLMPMFITPFGSFDGSGNGTVPVQNFAYFYITGWAGSGGGFTNPCGATGTTPSPRGPATSPATSSSTSHASTTAPPATRPAISTRRHPVSRYSPIRNKGPTMATTTTTKTKSPRARLRRMLATRRGTLALAGVCALIAAGALMLFLSSYRESVKGAAAPTPVLVATSLIQKGTSGDVLAEKHQFETVTRAADDVKEGGIADPALLAGKVTTADIYPGQQLTASSFVAATGTVLPKLADSDRAIAVPIDEAHGLVGQVQTGDHVDVLASYSTSSSATGQGQGVVKTLLQDKLVLRAGAQPIEGSDEGNAADKSIILRVATARRSRSRTPRTTGRCGSCCARRRGPRRARRRPRRSTRSCAESERPRASRPRSRSRTNTVTVTGGRRHEDHRHPRGGRAGLDRKAVEATLPGSTASAWSASPSPATTGSSPASRPPTSSSWSRARSRR